MRFIIPVSQRNLFSGERLFYFGFDAQRIMGDLGRHWHAFGIGRMIRAVGLGRGESEWHAIAILDDRSASRIGAATTGPIDRRGPALGGAVRSAAEYKAVTSAVRDFTPPNDLPEFWKQTGPARSGGAL